MANITVVLELDDSDFPTKLLNAEGSVVKFGNKVESASRSIKTMEGRSRDLISSMRDITVTLGTARQGFEMLESVTTGWAHRIIEVNAEFERMVTIMRSLSTSQNSLKESVDAVAQIRTMAKEAPFSLNAVHNAFVRMSSAGIYTKQNMKSLLDAVSAFGGTDNELNRAALAFQEMAGKGVVQMKELRNQLMMAVPSAGKLLASTFGVTYGEMMRDIHTGTVDASKVINGLLLEFDRAFGGASQNQMKTFNGLIGRMSVILQDIANKDIGKVFNADGTPDKTGFFGVVKQQLEDFNTFLAGNADGSGVAQGLGQQLGDMLTTVVLSFRSAIDEVIKFHAEIASGVEFAAFGVGLRMAVGILDFFNGVIERSREALKSFREQVAAYPAALQKIAAQSPEAKATRVDEANNRMLSAEQKFNDARAATVSAGARLWAAEEDAALDRSLINKRMWIDKIKALEGELEAAKAEEAASLGELKVMKARADAVIASEEGTASLGRMARGYSSVKELLPIVASGFGMVAAAAPWAGLAIAAAAEYFDIFHTKAKEAYDSLVQFGAASRAEAEKGRAYVNEQKALLEEMQKLRDNPNIMSRLTGIKTVPDSVFEKQKALVEQTTKQFDEIQKQGSFNQAQTEANKVDEALSRQIAGYQTDYNRRRESMAQAQAKEIEHIASLKRSSALADLEYQDRVRDNQLRLYDEELAAVKKVIDEQKKILDTPGASDTTIQMASALLNKESDRYDEILAKKKQTQEMTMGLPRHAKPLDDAALYIKGSQELEKLNASLAGYKAGIEGADEQAVKLYETWVRMARAGDPNVEKMRELYLSLKMVKQEADDYQKIWAGGNKLIKTYDDAIAENYRKVIELRTKGKDKQAVIDMETSLGLIDGYGGESPMAKHLTQMREKLDQNTKSAQLTGDTMRMSFGPSLVSNIVTVNDALVSMNNTLLNVMNGTKNPLTFNVQQGQAGGFLSGGDVAPTKMSNDEKGQLADQIRLVATHLGISPVDLGTVMSYETGGTFNKDKMGPGGHQGYIQFGTEEAAKFGYKPGQSVEQDMAAVEAYLRDHKVTPDTDLLHLYAAINAGDKNLVNASDAKNGGAPGTVTDKVNTMAPHRAAALGLLDNTSVRPEVSVSDQINGPGGKREQLAKSQAAVNQATSSDDYQKMMDSLKAKTDKAKAIIDGEGAAVAQVRDEIKKHGDWTKAQQDAALAAAKAKDQADKQQNEHKKKTTAADSALASITDKADSLASTNTNWSARLGRNPTAMSDQLERMHESNQAGIAKVVEGYGANSQQAQDARKQATAAEDRQRNDDVWKNAEAARKKTEAIRQSLMSQGQAETHAYDELKKKYDTDLANFRGTAEQKAQIEKIFTANLAAVRAQMDQNSPIAKTMKDWGNLSQNLESEGVNVLNGGIDNLVASIERGKVNWKQFANQILGDLAKIALKASLARLLPPSLGGGAAKTGGTDKSGVVGPNGPNMPSAGGGIFGFLGSMVGMVGMHHTGGIVGNPPAMRSLTASQFVSAFSSAPRFHTGGIIGAGEVPIIARRGEGVFTPAQMAAMGRSHSVNVNNNVTLHASGGTAEQNAELAHQVGQQVEQVTRATVVDELRKQMRSGNLLDTAGSGWNNP